MNTANFSPYYFQVSNTYSNSLCLSHFAVAILTFYLARTVACIHWWCWQEWPRKRTWNHGRRVLMKRSTGSWLTIAYLSLVTWLTCWKPWNDGIMSLEVCESALKPVSGSFCILCYLYVNTLYSSSQKVYKYLNYQSFLSKVLLTQF